MECLKQVSPEHWKDVPELRQFFDDLPLNPYCTNAKGFTYIRTKSHAIQHTHLQPNHPAICKWIAFDIDDPQALFIWFDEHLPPPQVIIRNPNNGHAHYLYRLTTPVGIGGRSSTKAVRYLISVQEALRKALKADDSYGGNLIKNPCHKDHETYLTGVQSSYTLAELAEYLDLAPLYGQTNKEPANDAGFGRNCTLFEELRHIAYKNPDKSYNAIFRHLEPIAEKLNNRFDKPLLPNEVKHIVKSIARYCARTDFNLSHERFSELQRTRATQRWGDNTTKKEQAQKMANNGIKIAEIARQLRVSRQTLYNWGLQRIK